MKKWAIAGCLATITAAPALAAPGLGEEVYGTQVRRGVTELEARYARLGGGEADGTDVLKLEATHHVNERLRLAAFGEFAHEPGAPRRAEELGVEAIYTLGSAGSVDFALYGEYAKGLNGNADALETKLIVQRQRGPLDLRFNLTVEKPLAAHQLAELSYAAAADYAVGEVKLGVEAFGELGTFERVFPLAGHYVGPRAAFEIEGMGPELELSAGYLFPVGTAHNDAKGQFRLAVELEF